MGGPVAQTYAVFGSYLLFKEVVADDLGRLFRAGAIVDGAVDRTVWLRLLDGAGLPRVAIASALARAREIGALLSGSQVPTGPFFLEADGVSAIGGVFVAGQPLNHVLQRARDEAFPLQPDNCLLIAEKLALGLSAGEAVQIGGRPLAHGFLHPGLICLSYDGDATVFGFGLGEALLGALGVPDAAPGARAYLAPEVLAGGGASLRGDVYSVGAVLFHLLTGTALPATPGEREAALAGAFMAWDGEPLPGDIKAVLGRALAMSPAGRYPSAAALRTELDRLLYGGAYSPTTFNLALFMDRLFRAEIEAEELERPRELKADPADYTVAAVEPESAATVADRGVTTDGPPSAVGPRPEAVEPSAPSRRRVGLWAAVGGAVVVGAAAALAWFWWATSQPKELPPTPEEIAAARQAQEDRLRTMTQEMVQEMMAQREEEIRQELSARQARIEELQRRLQQSERRAAKSSTAAADEAATQQALLRELQEQEEAQRAQQEALETERREGAGALVADASPSVPSPAPAESGEPASSPTSAALPTATVAAPPTQPPAKPTTAAAAARTVKAGELVAPEEVDTPPVVVKSQALEWPRNAARSKGKGVVVVKLTVNASGGVDDVEVLRADHTGWGIPEAALAAAAGYRYKPGTKDGVPVTTYAFVTWRYDFTEQ